MRKHTIDAMLTRIAAGDNDAFERLYIETKRGVYAFVYTYLGNRFDSEDALQNVYLKIKSNIRSYRPGTNGLAWILEIAKNTALNELRAQANRRKSEYAPNLVADDISDKTAVKELVVNTMREVLDEEEQRIVILHVVWGYRHREIAEIIGCPTGTVTSKYKRAVDKLKEALKEEDK